MAQDYHSQFRMTEVPVIIIISGAVLVVVMFLIFAKRQIMRFSIRGRRGVQSLDDSIPKVMRREIERRLECVQKIVHEPKLIADDRKFIIRNANGSTSLPPYYYRQRAVDDVKWLEKEISKHDGSVRLASDNLRSYLLNHLKGVNGGSGQQRLIHQFCDMYEHARHDPAEFGTYEYESYHRMLLKMVDAAKALKNYSRSPTRTPAKKANKTPSLLDPARLKPPPLTATEQGRMNISLGIQQRRQTMDNDDPFDCILSDSPKL